MSKKQKDSIPKITALNRLETLRFDYQVTIEQFPARRNELQLGIFSPPGREEIVLHLTVDTNLDSDDDDSSDEDEHEANANENENHDLDGTVKVELYLDSAVHKMKMHLNTSVLNEDGEKYEPEKKIIYLKEDDSDTIYRIEWESLKDDSKRLLPRSKLTLLIEFSLEVDDYIEKSPTTGVSNDASQQLVQYNDADNILLDYGQLLKLEEGTKFTDFTLVVRNREFRVLRGILAVRSPVFGAMFKHSEEIIEEVKNGRVEIPDIEPDVFEHFLCYLYTSRIPPMEKYAAECLMVADKYQIESLKSICEQWLITQLSPETMFNSLILADMHNAVKLKEKSMDYISNRASVNDALKALFANKLFGSCQSRPLIEAMRNLTTNSANNNNKDNNNAENPNPDKRASEEDKSG